jgi:hypothetical protein
LQLATLGRLVRWQAVPEFPAWPVDLSVSRLLRFYAFCRLTAQGKKDMRFCWFWPGSHTAALILTHDVESAEGLRLAVEVADLEEELGFRSSFNLGAWYPAGPGIVREARGTLAASLLDEFGIEGEVRPSDRLGPMGLGTAAAFPHKPLDLFAACERAHDSCR